jgi:hypothetical protein
LLACALLLLTCASSQTKPAAGRQSATPAAAAANGTAVIVMFTPWRDPREGAFSLNVPQGWQITGGAMRKASIDVRHVVRAASPDGKIQILIGDPGLLPNEVPNAGTRMARVREGQTMPAPWGGKLMIMRYRTGEQFSREYVSGKLCRTPKITRSGPLPEATNEFRQKAAAYGAATQTSITASVGDAQFQCGAQLGYVRTTIVMGSALSGPGAQVWDVLELSGYQAADASQEALARYVLNNMVGSFQLDPQWEARQAQTRRNVTASVTRAQQQMAASIASHARQQAKNEQFDVMKGWEANNKRRDSAMEKDTQARRGVSTADDPITGSHTVSNTYDYYWTRPDGSIVGTLTDTPPDYQNQWRPMTVH